MERCPQSRCCGVYICFYCMALFPTFTTLGAGPTVLMLHDADGAPLTLAPQVETLASVGYLAMAWDMPGDGPSAPIEPHTFKSRAESRRALLVFLSNARRVLQ